MTLTARKMTLADVPACVDIINYTVAQGGTTARETPYTHDEFAAQHLEDAKVANVVLDGDRLVGFQVAFEVDPGVYSIGSFTDQKDPVRGAGSVIMVKSKDDCRALGGTSIIAKITADNVPGLAYYSKMGFVDEDIWPNDHTRANGTQVDRVIKRFTL